MSSEATLAAQLLVESSIDKELGLEIMNVAVSRITGPFRDTVNGRLDKYRAGNGTK